MTTPDAPAPTKNRQGSFARLLREPLGVIPLVWIVLVALVAIFASLIAPHDPTAASVRNILGPADSEHLLGYDTAGRDVLSRLIYGARYSLLGALITATVSTVVGTVSGLIAGYYGKIFDSISNWCASLLMALPGMVVILAARSVVGPSMWWAMSIFGVLISASVFRLTRAAVQHVRAELYVDAARVSGVSDLRIITRHVLRNVRAPLIIQVVGIMSMGITMQAGLEFLGIGDLSMPSWGAMLNDGFQQIYRAPLLVLWPGLLIALTSLSLGLLGNALRDALAGTGAKQFSAPRTGSVAYNSASSDEVAAAVIHPTVASTAAAPAAPGERENILEVRDLHVAYQTPEGVKEVVRGVSFDIKRGEVLGLIGESGSGKTQTAFAVTRLLPVGGGITQGSVLWRGKDLASVSSKEMTRVRGAQISYIPQEPMSNLDPSFTIGEQLSRPLRRHMNMDRKQAKAHALQLLERVGIKDAPRVYRSYAHQISGGMAQRVLIACAISCEPDLLIADEPTTALDVTVQADILDLLRELQKEMNMGLLLVTHNFGVVADLCDRIAVMQNGLIVEQGTSDQIFGNQQHAYTQLLFDAILDESQVREPFQPSSAQK